MKKMLFAAALLLAVAGCTTTKGPRFDSYENFGAPVVIASKPLPLAKVVAELDKYNGQEVTVVSQIDEVCQVMGCWMTLKDGPANARVRFTASESCAEGFYVPRNAMGHEVVILGTIEMKDVPEDWARHYAEDQGATPEEIAKIVGPQKEVTIIATGVRISEPEKLDAPRTP